MTAANQTIDAFLSHASVDAEAGFIDPLEQEMQLRGIGVWRDKHQLLAGHHNWDEIRSAIDRCTAFVVVVTPNSLERPAVWDELRHADRRWQQDPSFPMIPVRIGVGRDELNEHCHMKGVHRLSDQQDIDVSLGPGWTPAADPGWAARVAGRILASAIDRHLRLNDRELVVAVRTMTERTLTAPDLDLDWAACFEPEPDGATWDRLLAALEDLADAIKRQTRQERFSAHLLARIGVGVALGWAIPRTSARKIDVVHSDARSIWPSDVTEADDGHTDYVETQPEVVIRHSGRSWCRSAGMHMRCTERSPAIARAGHLLEVNRPEEDPMTAETAAAAALRIGRTIRRWCDTADIRQVRLAGAMPIGLAILYWPSTQCHRGRGGFPRP